MAGLHNPDGNRHRVGRKTGEHCKLRKEVAEKIYKLKLKIDSLLPWLELEVDLRIHSLSLEDRSLIGSTYLESKSAYCAVPCAVPNANCANLLLQFGLH